MTFRLINEFSTRVCVCVAFVMKNIIKTHFKGGIKICFEVGLMEINESGVPTYNIYLKV